MKTLLVRTLGVVVFLATLGAAQDVIPLPTSAGPNSTQENYPEREYFSKIWSTDVVTNVTKPSLTVFKPSPELRNGTALVICPGGSFMALDINSEGNDVAKYVTARGVTAFVLKYRLAHTGEDAVQELNEMLKDGQKLREMLGKTVPLAVADGLAAVFKRCYRSSGCAAHVCGRCHRRRTRTRAGKCFLVREVDRRAQIGRTAYLLERWPRLRNAKAKATCGSLDRQVHRLDGVTRMVAKVTPTRAFRFLEFLQCVLRPSWGEPRLPVC